MEINIVQVLCCILGCLVALWIAIIQIRLEFKKMWSEGIHTTAGMEISDDDVRKIAELVLEELDRRKRDGHD